jgi:hypothetical protein
MNVRAMTTLTPCLGASSLSFALVGSLLLVTSAPRAADVFKCAGGNGVPTYQDTPCPAGKELRNFQTDPPAITVLPAPELTLEPPPTQAKPAPRLSAPSKPPPPATGMKAAGDAAERRFLRHGMTEGEVIGKVGSPAITRRGGQKSTTHWTYLPAPGDPETITIVMFSKGVVTDIQRKVSK